MNVALYGPQRDAWAFTEQGHADVRRYRSALVIGQSSMEWESDSFVVRFDERTAPLPGRVSGVVRVHPLGLAEEAFALDAEGRHRWGPIAPLARCEVEIRKPEPMRWSGTAYVDSNAGDEPLEDGFFGWSWCRASTRKRTTITYEAARRDRSSLYIARSFDASGRSEPAAPLAARPLVRTLWGMDREVRVDHGDTPRLIRTLEDTPFYARSQIAGRVLGEHAHGVHEALDLDRFKSRVVQFMLPYRMRRVRS
jgi:carotenoid 1,2-hydratase